jgi:flagellar assembly protein FliH
MTLTSKPKSDAGASEAKKWTFAPLNGDSGFAGNSNLNLDNTEEPLSGKQMAQRALESAYQRGLTEGFRAGSEHVKNEATEMGRRIDQLIESMQSQFTNMDTDVADAVLGLAFSLAKQIIRAELDVRPELVSASVRDALGSLALRASDPRIYLNPADLNLVRASLSDDLTIRGCRLLADTGISRGGCRLESDTSMVDATLESRWERALSNMGYSGNEFDNVTTAR